MSVPSGYMPSTLATVHDRLKYVEKTKNGKGYMFHKIGESAHHWINSLPSSSLPLLDLGSAYGVHTFHSMKTGRDVIALDICSEHLDILKERATALISSTPPEHLPKMGKLRDTIVAALPDASLFKPASTAGVLLSELLHLLQPGEPLQVLKDVYKWLYPGGLVVVTCTTGEDLESAVRIGFKFRKGRSVEEVRKVLAGPEEELLRESPTFVQVPDGAIRSVVGDTMYLMTKKELGVMARHVGFEVLQLICLNSGKYPFRCTEVKDGLDTVQLVAKKPLSS